MHRLTYTCHISCITRPLRDLRFVLNELLQAQQLSELPRYAEFTTELADSVLEEAARFGEQVLAPINCSGIRAARSIATGAVQMPEEFRAAYQQFVAAGWPQLSARPSTVARARRWCWRWPRKRSGSAPTWRSCSVRSCAAARSMRSSGGFAGTAAAAAAEDGHRRMDRHHESHRAAGRLGSGRDPHACTPDGDHYRISGQKIFILTASTT